MSADPTFVRSGFGDEIADDLETQLEVMDSLGLSSIDLRSVGGTNVLDFSDAQIAEIHDLLDEYGFEVACIGSPIGKIGIEDDFDPHLERFETAIEMAHEFDTPYIRLFSYWMPEGEDPADYRDEVMRRMRAKADLAEQEDVIMLHENEKDIYGDTAARCRDLMTTVDSPNFRMIFDPANFLEVSVHPFPDALLQVVEFVEYLHVKDAVFGERHNIVPAGEGDGDVPAVLSALRDRGFSGYAALEPHLAEQDEMGGYSGPEAYEVATKALDGILDDIGASYV